MGNDEAIIYGDRHGETYRELTYKDDGEPDGPVTAGSEVKVHYPNAIKLNSIGGRDVQVGVITFDQDTGERNITQYDQDGDPIGEWDSLWASLDRQGINRLIRELRRLRDRVFGADA
jgi:hypothetical protein